MTGRGKTAPRTIPRALRLHRPGKLVSAGYFDAVYPRCLEGTLTLTDASPSDFASDVLGHWPASAMPDTPKTDMDMPDMDMGNAALESAAARFQWRCQGFEFFCPGYEAVRLAPLFALLRNISGAPVRILLIAHAPGAYLMEWALLQHLLGPADCIIAPSRSAWDIITHCAPALAVCTRVAHHPMPRPDSLSARSSHSARITGVARLASLSRIAPGKLLHRQLDAMALLRHRGVLDSRLEIAGPLEAEDRDDLSAYARALLQRRRRLDLEHSVAFPGGVSGENAKDAFFAHANLALCLSNTIEEAFPKTTVEALWRGVPVLAARFGGYVETVGEAGALLPMEDAGAGADVSPEGIANAVEALLAQPPSASACREQAARFLPERASAMYAEALGEALGHPLSTRRRILREARAARVAWSGLLGATAPLSCLSAPTLLRAYVQETPQLLRALRGERIRNDVSLGACIRQMVNAACGPEIQRRMAGLPAKEALEETHAAPLKPPRITLLSGHTPAALLYAAATSAPPSAAATTGQYASRAALAPHAATTTYGPHAATAASRRCCVSMLQQLGETGLFQDAVRRLWRTSPCTPGLQFLRAQAHCLQAETGAEKAAAMRRLAALCGQAFHHAGGAAAVRSMAAWGRRLALSEALWLPTLEAWLQAFPDEEQSGAVWLDAALAHAQQGALPRAQLALDHAQALLGAHPLVTQVKDCLPATAAVAGAHRALALLVTDEPS